jgi:hypothetical protein
MPVYLIPENELRAALRPYRVDPSAFEAGVRTRMEAAQRQRADEPLVVLSPFLRSAAAFLPLAVLAGCKTTPATAKLVPAVGVYKLLSYLAFPAISLFLLIGATIFSIAKIRGIQSENEGGLENQEAMREAVRQWWKNNKWGALALFAATLILSLVGAAWLLFLLYIVSFGILLYVLATFAKAGLGNRQLIGQSCSLGLMFLGQVSGIAGIGIQDIHFLDQTVVAAVFLGGALVLMPVGLANSPLAGWRMEKLPRWMWGLVPVQLLVALIVWLIYPSLLILVILLAGVLVPLGSMIYRSRFAGQRIGTGQQWTMAGAFAVVVVPLIVWMIHPVLWPATSSRFKSYVESFDEAPHEMVSWQRWEIVADWAIDSKLDPDFSSPRRLLAQEISGGQNPYILGSALRVGLVPADQVGQLKDYQERRRSLVGDPPSGLKPQVIASLAQFDWVIRGAVLRKDLSLQERDLLEQRLHATLEDLSQSRADVLETALRVTQLLEVIERPLNRDQYRDRVHDWLRKFHAKNAGGFQYAGGFTQYLDHPVGSLESTSYAVDMMEIYGVPDDLDLNWVRSFLRPSVYRLSDDKWIAAATLARLNHLPGLRRPTWLEVLYYERTLLAAAVLVGLCIYATLISPQLKIVNPAQGLAQPDSLDPAIGTIR